MSKIDDDVYTRVCVLRRCGSIEGCKDAKLPVFDTDKDGNIFEMPIDGRKLVIDEMWNNISSERCAQFYCGLCITRYDCRFERSHCYPFTSRKRANRVVIVMFAWYCADAAADAADARADARADAHAAADAARAATDAAHAAVAAVRAHAAADAARAATDAAHAATDAARAATARAAHAAADAARAAAAAAARAAAAVQDFYFNAARELERLINTWGDPR